MNFMTKYACPRCQQAGITGIAKRWSARAFPAECANCGGLSHVLASTSSGIGVGTVLILVGALVVAAGGMSWLVAVSGICLSAAFNMWAWRRAELFPIPKESASNARATVWFLTVLAAISGLLGSS